MSEKKRVLTIEIEENYPDLFKLGLENPKEMLSIIRSLLLLANDAVKDDKNHHLLARQHFGMNYGEVARQVMDGLFDLEGAMAFHGDKKTASFLLNLKGFDNHPLSKNFTDLMDQEGNPITHEEKFGFAEGEMTIKKWIQSLVFYSHFLSLKDLAEALSVSNYVLADEIVYDNLKEIIDIQPALKLQRERGIMPLKTLDGTGAFDVGERGIPSVCVACQIPDTLKVHKQMVICVNCKAGYKKE